MHRALITHVERPNIVDALLTPFFIMPQGTWLYVFFPIMAANTFIIHSNNQIASELPDLQDQKLLTLR